MSSLVSAIDNFTPSKIGENGTVEYTWSNKIQEQIVQLHFQLTRTNSSQQKHILHKKLDNIIQQIKDSYANHSITELEKYTFLSVLYRMIGHTRDIINGKGEYSLAFMLLDAWSKHYPFLAEFAFKHFLCSSDANEHPYGSWKDLKNLYKEYPESPLIPYACALLVEQLRKDSISEQPSLAAKWVPREKTGCNKLFNMLATSYFSNYIETAKTEESKRKAIIKTKMDFRKLIARLNRQLDTVQIKQCSNKWSEIDPRKQTSVTMNKQKNAFLNISKNKSQRSTFEDRINCANNFTAYIKSAIENKRTIKGKRIGLNDFTSEAIRILNENRKDSLEAELLNAQWRDNSSQTKNLGKMVAMVDVSGSMHGDPLHAAIALGIRIAEKSILGKRVMTFSDCPNWVNLSNAHNFIEMVDITRLSPWRMNTNFSAALNLILESIVQANLDPDSVEDMALVILSDMQMDCAGNHSKSLMDEIALNYANTGISLWGKPFKAPHIIFWNLRSTSGFPTLSTTTNVTMMSGFSPSLLNAFEQDLETLKTLSSWDMLVDVVNNNRYDILEEFLRTELH